MKTLTNDIIEACRNTPEEQDWINISLYCRLNESFMREFQDKILWSFIVRFQRLSESFIREFQDKMDWHCVGIFHTLSESFIEEFQDKLSWYGVSEFQKLSKAFVIKHHDKINYDVYLENPHVIPSIFNKYKRTVKIDDHYHRIMARYYAQQETKRLLTAVLPKECIRAITAYV